MEEERRERGRHQGERAARLLGARGGRERERVRGYLSPTTLDPKD